MTKNFCALYVLNKFGTTREKKKTWRLFPTRLIFQSGKASFEHIKCLLIVRSKHLGNFTIIFSRSLHKSTSAVIYFQIRQMSRITCVIYSLCISDSDISNKFFFLLISHTASPIETPLTTEYYEWPLQEVFLIIFWIYLLVFLLKIVLGDF